MALQIRSTITKAGLLELSLADLNVPEPRSDQVVVRVEASPINPSDLGLLFGMADMSTATVSGTPERPVVTARVPPDRMHNLRARVDQSMPVGNEGTGIVVDAGSDDEAQALMGKTVAMLGGAMYSQFRCIRANQCLVLPEGTTPAEGASCFVNPLTALGMVETMRVEGYSALVHTAAASNLGQILNRICMEENVGLVNVVRRAEHVDLLRRQGAAYVCNSSAGNFMEELIAALVATGATLAFDATGGGTLASQILTAMEAAANAPATEYSRYGSTTHKQVYIYGGLERSPTELTRNFGMAWGIGGWLLPPFLQQIGPEAVQTLKARVAAGIRTTFASGYAKEISLAEALQLDAISVYAEPATGGKYLIYPNKDL